MLLQLRLLHLRKLSSSLLPRVLTVAATTTTLASSPAAAIASVIAYILPNFASVSHRYDGSIPAAVVLLLRCLLLGLEIASSFPFVVPATSGS